MLLNEIQGRVIKYKRNQVLYTSEKKGEKEFKKKGKELKKAKGKGSRRKTVILQTTKARYGTIVDVSRLVM